MPQLERGQTVTVCHQLLLLPGSFAFNRQSSLQSIDTSFEEVFEVHCLPSIAPVARELCSYQSTLNLQSL